MCGVCGFIRFNNGVEANVLQKMNNAIRHRGSDDEGYMCLDNDNKVLSYTGKDSVPEAKNDFPSIDTAPVTKIGMAFMRLAIIDLSYCAHQPMISDDRHIALTFNGEIYNYKELRAELQQAGFKFKSTSDTEVILNGYRHWGRNVLKRLNGMFAIVIYDHADKKLFIARDRLGIKPLFYHYDNNGITWASEMKAIIKAPWVKPTINWEGLFLNYQLQTTPSPVTCFQNINSLEPACWMDIDIDTGRIKKERYWYIPLVSPTIKISKEDAVNYLDNKLQQIVSMQLRSDVPVTSLMSGGIDSTTLTAICAKQNPDFRCYTLGFDGSGQGADEIPQATEMAKKLGIKQYVHLIKPSDVLDDLDATLKHFEEPYFSLETGVVISKYLHQQDYKVVINGLGADEVFGGYAHYLNYKKWLSSRKLSFVEAFIPPIGIFPKKLKSYLGLDSVLKYFINSRLGLRPYEIEELNKRPFAEAGLLLNEPGIEQPHKEPVSLFYYDLKYYIGSHHVYRDDLSSMKYSIESRYPFLDHELIEWISTLPLSIRFGNKITKPLLKDVSRRYITDTNLNMPKRGFNIPLAEWLKHDTAIQEYTREKLNALRKRDIFNEDTIEKWWEMRNKGVCFSKIWQMVTTEVWLEEYIES